MSQYLPTGDFYIFPDDNNDTSVYETLSMPDWSEYGLFVGYDRLSC